MTNVDTQPNTDTASDQSQPETGADAVQNFDEAADGATSDLRKKELIDLVVARSGVKRKDAKPVVEAMLGILGEAVGAGRELTLQPLGKLMVNRVVDKQNARVIVCKLRQGKAAARELNDPLAESEMER